MLIGYITVNQETTKEHRRKRDEAAKAIKEKEEKKQMEMLSMKPLKVTTKDEAKLQWEQIHMFKNDSIKVRDKNQREDIMVNKLWDEMNEQGCCSPTRAYVHLIMTCINLLTCLCLSSLNIIDQMKAIDYINEYNEKKWKDAADAKYGTPIKFNVNII
jgi:hypothetical protein